MEEQFWHERWQSNATAFHEGRPNELLQRHLPALGLPQGARILVPLCGKSRDLHWLLAQGYRVAGVELSRLAVEQLFAELGTTPRIATDGALARWEADGLVLHVGNLFALDPAALGTVDAIYDRAALVALPEPMRRDYAAHLVALAPGAPQLLISFEYDQALLAGPPFAVTEAEITRLYGASHHVACLERRAVPGGLKGICPAEEAAWLLTPR